MGTNWRSAAIRLGRLFKNLSLPENEEEREKMKVGHENPNLVGERLTAAAWGRGIAPPNREKSENGFYDV